jgi:nitroimidazol reductase NimA-like FMN-containing flavoprotein (pyridoxamine 5'-phosphate oxidase superfamily)
VATAERAGLGLLDRAECLQLLGRSTFGRIGITVGALPVVLPVNYRLVDDRIVFRTGHGSKLDAATRNSIVAFEVDDIDPVSHSGWSVMVTGEAREITDPDELAHLDDAGIPHWAHSEVDATLEVATTMLSGRRIGPPR